MFVNVVFFKKVLPNIERLRMLRLLSNIDDISISLAQWIIRQLELLTCITRKFVLFIAGTSIFFLANVNLSAVIFWIRELAKVLSGLEAVLWMLLLSVFFGIALLQLKISYKVIKKYHKRKESQGTLPEEIKKGKPYAYCTYCVCLPPLFG